MMAKWGFDFNFAHFRSWTKEEDDLLIELSAKLKPEALHAMFQEQFGTIEIRKLKGRLRHLPLNHRKAAAIKEKGKFPFLTETIITKEGGKLLHGNLEQEKIDKLFNSLPKEILNNGVDKATNRFEREKEYGNFSKGHYHYRFIGAKKKGRKGKNMDDLPGVEVFLQVVKEVFPCFFEKKSLWNIKGLEVVASIGDEADHNPIHQDISSGYKVYKEGEFGGRLIVSLGPSKDRRMAFQNLEADENIVLTDNCILMDAIVAGMGGKHKMFHGRLDKGVTLVLDLGLKVFGLALNNAKKWFNDVSIAASTHVDKSSLVVTLKTLVNAGVLEKGSELIDPETLIDARIAKLR
eukprot:g1073.t1